MPLTVLSVAYPMAVVGPDAVGGAEQVLAMLDEALVREGCQSIVVASRGSLCWGTLVPTPMPRAPFDEDTVRGARRNHREAIEWALRRWQIDLIHLHGIDFFDYLPPPGPPALVTLHLPPSWYPAEALRPIRPNTWIACVSDRQLRACPQSERLLGALPNGVRLDRFRPRAFKRGYVLALGRICPEKGAHLALAAAREAAVPLVLAGEVFPYPEHQRYFQQAVIPLLDGLRRFIGPVGLERKRRLLAGARCVLVPSLVEETSSLVAMEALASGTPVVAFRRGALKDIVEHGRTGFLVDGVSQMAEAIGQVGALRTEDCRSAAEERFSAGRTVRAYLNLYRELSGVGRGANSRPTGAAPAADIARPRASAGARSTLQVEEIASAGELCDLAPSWAELFDRSAAATPFQHPDWLLPWCRHFPPAEPWAVLLVRAGRLMGMAPLLVYRAGERRVATLLGTGISDVTGVLLDDDIAAVGARVLVDHLLRQRERWDVCIFEQLQSDSPLLRALREKGLRLQVTPQDRCLALRLPQGRGDLSSAVPRNMRRNLQRYRHRAEELGPVSFHRSRPEDLDRHLSSLVQLHNARWESRGQDGVLGGGVAEFHRDVVRRFSSSRRLVLSELRVEGRAAAAIYGFLNRDRMYLYLMGMDPTLGRVSPGTLILGHALREALDLGLRELDMLRGTEEYKYLWGPVERMSWRASLEHGAPAPR